MENWLNKNEKGVLRFLTAGSVDDGKSTLIGRLLYDSKSIFEDQLEAVTDNGEINLANLTDGLRAEREQGITIDVAYRYFATPNRKFIIADAPGHVEYTRNMVTAASSSNLALILIDARKGVIEQTKRHTYLASLLRIPNLVVCVNKMDLVDFKEEIFEQIKQDYLDFSESLWMGNIWFVPISALNGDNVVNKTENLSWFKGPHLLQYLEQVPIIENISSVGARLPVQYVIRPRDDKHHDFRGYAGRMASGELSLGQEVVILPSNKKSKIKELFCASEKTDKVSYSMAVTVCIEDQIDISRGDVICSASSPATVLSELTADVFWMQDQPCWKNQKYLIKLGTKTVKGMVTSIHSVLDISTLEQVSSAVELKLNDIGKISFKLASPVAFDSFSKNQNLGSFIIIDEINNNTLGAGIILDPNELEPQKIVRSYSI